MEEEGGRRNMKGIPFLKELKKKKKERTEM
jgi:hypothetical protein